MARYTPTKQKTLNDVYVPAFPSDRLPAAVESLWSELWTNGGGVYNSLSYNTIVDYCRLQNLADEAWRDLQHKGLVTEGSLGQEVMSVEFKAFKEIQTMLTTLRDRLGLSPRAAAEIGLTAANAAAANSKLEGFLNAVKD